MPIEDLSFASVDQLQALIQGFKLNEANAPETSSDALQDLLNGIAGKIIGEWDRLYNKGGRGKNPAPSRPTNPSDANLINLILELLNLEEAWIKLTNNFIALKYKEAGLYSKSFSWLQEARRKTFRDGGLTKVIIKYINGESLENDSFLDDADLARQSPGLTLTQYTQPSLATAIRIGLRESAWVRAEGCKHGYKNKISQLNSNQKTNWRTLVKGLTQPQVKMIALSKDYDAIINETIYTSLKNAYAELEIFSKGTTRSAFM